VSRPIEGPVSQVPWSPDFLAQTLEVLIVHRAGDGIVSLRPVHAPSLQLGWRPGTSPDTILRAALRRYGLEARVLHSTSWRDDGEHVILTYLAVVDPPAESNENLASEPVARADLARGDATAAPASIQVEQVLEHALRHLAWLVADDRAVGESLPDWPALLAHYLPEPFRSLSE
jgi:hypothetical protein